MLFLNEQEYRFNHRNMGKTIMDKIKKIPTEKSERCYDLRSCINKRKRRYVPKAISGIYDYGVYMNL